MGTDGIQITTNRESQNFSIMRVCASVSVCGWVCVCLRGGEGGGTADGREWVAEAATQQGVIFYLPSFAPVSVLSLA